jgi:hypothetical protein
MEGKTVKCLVRNCWNLFGKCIHFNWSIPLIDQEAIIKLVLIIILLKASPYKIPERTIQSSVKQSMQTNESMIIHEEWSSLSAALGAAQVR